MGENYELVQRGFRLLLTAMSGYVGQAMSKVYREMWWEEVLSTLSDQRDLPQAGTYGELLDSLDIANCIRLIDRKWNDVFRDLLPLNCRTWAKELMGVRNRVSHLGPQDLEQREAERALDTMALLCSEIDEESAGELRELYHTVRSRAEDTPARDTQPFVGLAQPASLSRRGALTEGSLLQKIDTDTVQRTALTRKVTYGGKTMVYPVYRVRLDALYFNDQNDRIATWISRYEAEHGPGALSRLDTEHYNQVIEEFIYESNPEMTLKDQKNIAMLGQTTPGVTLADGRVVDGNRRFTCLRRIQRETGVPCYFETVLMDMDIQEDKKQIKLLELAVQHGERKKVEYDLIDYALGTYRDVMQTGLLTAEEYAATADEPLAEVKKRIEVVELISEFLSYLKLPEQYHVAREYQVYSLFQEMLPPLKKLNGEERAQLKRIVFHNAMMKAIPDQRKFIRDIKGLVKSDTYGPYFEDQQKWGRAIAERFAAAEIHSKQDVDRFAADNSQLTEELQLSMEKALLRSRAKQLKSKPVEHVTKSIALMMEVDSRLFGKMDAEERETLKAELDELEKIVKSFQKLLTK